MKADTEELEQVGRNAKATYPGVGPHCSNKPIMEIRNT